MKRLFTFFAFIVCLNVLQAQSSKDVTVPLSATISLNPASVTLNWPNPGNANLLVRRRIKGQGGTSWQQILSQSSSNLSTVTDNNVMEGQVYEYSIQRTVNSLVAYGYAHVAVQAGPVDSRGKILIFVDAATAAALSPELTRLHNDLLGDGWWPVEYLTDSTSTVQSVKSQITTAYNAEPTLVKSVLLLGDVPIPYSGNSAWDGHSPDHTGAWPCDAYYADVNGIWTDVSINNTVPNRDANDNIPGDGKFDQNYVPSNAELQVGRVDFRRINAAAFGAADQTGLMKRYLDKNHQWRIGEYTVQNKALVDDNFGYFGGEAFASNGYRNAYPLVGESNIVEADFFNDTDTQGYLLGYGCGGGNYNGAGGVGSSTNFATDSVNIVFSNLFGSYFGDWDYETNPFMPSALASRGGILTCSWAGRPHWFNQALASGETVGYCMKETVNAQFNSAFAGSFGKGGAHVALLGDPSLRAHVLKPATNLTLLNPDCQRVMLEWAASGDSVEGYHIYRTQALNGPYNRLTTDLVTDNHYTDNNPVPGTLYYQVRAIKTATSPGGGAYANNSVGALASIDFVLPPQAEASVNGYLLNCSNQTVEVQSGNDTPGASYFWIGPNNFSSNLSNPTVTSAGAYILSVSLGNCSSSDTVEVTAATMVNLSFVVSNETTSNAQNGAIDLAAENALGTLSYLWSTGATTEDLTELTAGTYTVTVTDAATGCTSLGTVMVGIATSTEEATYFEQFQLSPNPGNGIAGLHLKLHQTAVLRVEIRDVSGRLIREDPQVKSKELQLPIDLTHQPSGMYTVAVWADNQAFVRKLQVIR